MFGCIAMAAAFFAKRTHFADVVIANGKATRSRVATSRKEESNDLQ